MPFVAEQEPSPSTTGTCHAGAIHSFECWIVALWHFVCVCVCAWATGRVCRAGWGCDCTGGKFITVLSVLVFFLDSSSLFLQQTQPLVQQHKRLFLLLFKRSPLFKKNPFNMSVVFSPKDAHPDRCSSNPFSVRSVAPVIQRPSWTVPLLS